MCAFNLNSPKSWVFHDINLKFLLVLCNESTSPWVMYSSAHRNLDDGSGPLVWLGQVSVSVTPFTSLIYLNYKQFGKSVRSVIVTGSISALLLLENIILLHWENKCCRQEWEKSSRILLKWMKKACPCPLFTETYLEITMKQTYPNLHQVWGNNDMFLKCKKGTNRYGRCLLTSPHSPEMLSWWSLKEEMSHWLSWIAGFYLLLKPRRRKVPLEKLSVPWFSSVT